MSHICKKLINDVEKCVDDSMEGLVMVNPGLRLVRGHRIIIRSDIEQLKKIEKVAVICGGGSGHEPAYGGFVGEGMLSASVSGAVFASPPPNHILTAIRAVAKGNPGGCLVVVTNYTGDRLNFGQAVEQAKQEGLSVNMLVVGEDCALASSDKTAGRRGLAGTLLILKVWPIIFDCTEKAYTQSVGERLGKTLDFSLSSFPSSPSFPLSSFFLFFFSPSFFPPFIPLPPPHSFLFPVCYTLTGRRVAVLLWILSRDHVACVINNLGGTSLIEMNIISKETIGYLENMGVVVQRAYCGSLITSLEMAGISITVLHIDDSIKECLDYSTTAPAWPHPLLPHSCRDRQTPVQIELEETAEAGTSKTPLGCSITKDQGTKLFDILTNVADHLLESEMTLNDLDKESGDGDCGSTMARGARLLKTELGERDNPGLPVDHPYQLALSLANIAGNSMGGASGGVYSLFFTSAAKALIGGSEVENWSEALKSAIQAIRKYGHADPGDRTMLDALCPAFRVLEEQLKLVEPVEAFRQAFKAAEKGAESTIV
ncbi:hypothetical protein ScPMuIL_014221 [Solemya velum]